MFEDFTMPEYQNFTKYAVARRARALGEKENLIPEANIQEGLALETQKFKTAFDEYQKYNKGLLSFLVETGIIDERQKANLSKYDYIPFYRIIEEESYEIIAQGNAGQLGNASGKVIIFLKEIDKTTVLNYEADTRINGRIAQLGSRLIDGSVKKNTDLFFQNFSKALNEDSKVILNDKKNNTTVKKVKVLTCLILLFLIILFIGLYVR